MRRARAPHAPGVPPPPALDDIAAALRARGLALRGAFHPAPDDAVPPLPDGRAAGTVVLAGQTGPETWAAFARERRDEPDPLDAWSARALRAVADAFGAALVLPQDGPPFAPFQRWARRAEAVHPSPLGIAIHPDWGLWHAWRGALLLAPRLELPPRDARPAPCASCATRSCLSACPVGAYAAPGSDGAARYDVARCVAHVASPAGVACREGGCLARRACPVARTRAYPAAQQRFHMEAFLAAHLGSRR